MSLVSPNWYHDLAIALAVRPTAEFYTFCKAWQRAEGGEATHNPFNATRKDPGSTDYNTNGGFPVQNYVSKASGVRATDLTLRQSNFADLLLAIHRNANPYYLAIEVGKSPWGSDSALICEILWGDGYGATS